MNICMVMIVSHLTLGKSLWLWPLTNRPKNSGVLLLNGCYYPFYFKGSGSSGTQVIGNLRFLLFGTLCPWPFTYWPQNRSPLLNKGIHYMKFEGSGWKRTPVIEWNVFTYGAPVTLTFNLLFPKSIGFFTQEGLSSYEVSRLWVNGYWSYWTETVFTLRVTVTLTFDLLTPKSIGVFYSKRLPWFTRTTFSLFPLQATDCLLAWTNCEGQLSKN